MPTAISVGAGVCQASSPSGSYVAGCDTANGGVILFCSDNVCSKNCSQRAFTNAVCAAATHMQSNSASSMMATCDAIVSPPPSAAPKPLTGPVPSTIPSNASSPPNATAPVASGAAAAGLATIVGAAAAAALAAVLA